MRSHLKIMQILPAVILASATSLALAACDNSSQSPAGETLKELGDDIGSMGDDVEDAADEID